MVLILRIKVFHSTVYRTIFLSAEKISYNTMRLASLKRRVKQRHNRKQPEGNLFNSKKKAEQQVKPRVNDLPELSCFSPKT